MDVVEELGATYISVIAKTAIYFSCFQRYTTYYHRLLACNPLHINIQDLRSQVSEHSSHRANWYCVRTLSNFEVPGRLSE